jgi:hypothetical protein
MTVGNGATVAVGAGVGATSTVSGPGVAVTTTSTFWVRVHAALTIARAKPHARKAHSAVT